MEMHADSDGMCGRRHAGVGAAILPGGIVVSDPPRMHESASCGTRERACAAYIYLHPYHTLDM